MCMTDISKLYRVTVLAKRHKVSQQTLHSAVSTGRIASVSTGCGLPLVTEAAVKKYLANGRRGPGRPRKEQA